MATKGVKSLLKAAKAAVGKRDYHEAARICQEIFAVEEGNYTGHVFAGLAGLELGRYAEAKQHYKTAIASQPAEQLAWKGLANYYDKHAPSGREEVEDALKTYQTLLTFLESDTAKKRTTLTKLAALWRETGDSDQMAATYSSLLDTYPAEEQGGEEVAGLWAQLTTALLAEKNLGEPAWRMLERGVEAVVGGASSVESRLDCREQYIPLLLGRLKVQEEGEEGAGWAVCDRLRQHCREVLELRPCSLPALTATAYLTLVDLTRVFPEQPGREVVTEWTQTVLERLHQQEREGSVGDEGKGGEGLGGGGGGGLGCVGMACVRVAQGQWKDASTLAETGLSLCPSLYEAHLLLSWTRLKLHDYTAALQQARSGLSAQRKFPPLLAQQLVWKLKLQEARALLGLSEDSHSRQALALLTELCERTSCDRHVMVALTRAHLALGDTAKAEEAVQTLQRSSHADIATANMLQGEICLAQENVQQALIWFDSALEQQCVFPECLLLKGQALWSLPDDSSKIQAYSALLLAAKADPYNPDVFLYIGHYQNLVVGDGSRALKCYQKAVYLQPGHVEALTCAADLLFATGFEEEAFNMYSKITTTSSAAKAKQAWLKLGLYHRQKGQFSDAIHCFQSALTPDTSDKQCWECLAEAYLARGSHTSALRAFSKVVELDPTSVYCLYQLSNIRQVLGELREAVEMYSSVLALQPDYLPALKGRGHTHFLLALSSLRQNFDPRAVDHVASALADLTRAASVKPRFLCVWKLIGDCCTCLHQVNAGTARPSVPAVLLGKEGTLEDTAVVEKTELFLIGCRAYGRALQLSPDSSTLWHDLSLAYYHLTEISDVAEKKAEYIQSAFNVVKRALSLSPADHTHWNALGVIAAHSALDRPAVAQHAFIRSIQLEANNGLAWTNLGALYLKHGQMELAHKSFRTAQSLDPGYAAAWIGQATIAHSIGHTDCMDLYRHTTQLEYHSEACRGYGYWVCHTLTTIEPRAILEPGGEGLNLVAARGMLQARDCLQKYVEREPGDGWALNLLGLLYEQEGLLVQAERAFCKAGRALGATPSTNTSPCSAVSVNRARLLSALGRHAESVELWSALDLGLASTDLPTRLQFALAMFRAGNYTESLQAYESVLSSSSGDKHKSAILSTCAMVAYAQGDIIKSKTFLFEAFQATPPSLHGVVGLCVLGCLTSDLTLLQAALQEMNKILEWESGDGQALHISCLLALRIIKLSLETSHKSSECVEAISSVLKQLPDTQQYTEAPPLPLTLPSLADAATNPASLLPCAQRLLHSYPGSVWSMAALTHAVEQGPLKTRYQTVLQHYVQCNISSLRGDLHNRKQALQQLQTWLSRSIAPSV